MIKYMISVLLLMSMKYRSRTEIVYQILQIAKTEGDGAARTKIMYKAFLSYAQLREYLTVMTDNDLLQFESDTQRFKITEKGLRFMSIYDQIGTVMEQQQQQ